MSVKNSCMLTIFLAFSLLSPLSHSSVSPWDDEAEELACSVVSCAIDDDSSVDIPDLPIEVLIRVFSFLPTQDYMQLATVSKFFYTINHDTKSLLAHFAQIAKTRDKLGIRFVEIEDRFRMMWHGHIYQHKKKRQTLWFCEQYEADLELLWKEVMFHLLGLISIPKNFSNESVVANRVFDEGLPTELLYLIKGYGLPINGHDNVRIENRFKIPHNPSRYLCLNLILILNQVVRGVDAALDANSLERCYLSQNFCQIAMLVKPHLNRILPEFDDSNLELCRIDKWARKYWIYFEGVGLIRMIPNPAFEPSWEEAFDEMYEM